MSEDLKPCPQCGGQVRNTQKVDRLCIECEMDLPYDHNDWWYVKELEKKDKLCRELLKELLIWNEDMSGGDFDSWPDKDLIKRAEEILK